MQVLTRISEALSRLVALSTGCYEVIACRARALRWAVVGRGLIMNMDNFKIVERMAEILDAPGSARHFGHAFIDRAAAACRPGQRPAKKSS